MPPVPDAAAPSLRPFRFGLIIHVAPLRKDLDVFPSVPGSRGYKLNAAVEVFFIIPAHKFDNPSFCICDLFKGFRGVLGAVFERFE